MPTTEITVKNLQEFAESIATASNGFLDCNFNAKTANVLEVVNANADTNFPDDTHRHLITLGDAIGVTDEDKKVLKALVIELGDAIGKSFDAYHDGLDDPQSDNHIAFDALAKLREHLGINLMEDSNGEKA